MFVVIVFLASVLMIFAIHVFALRKAMQEHQELLTMSWPTPEEAEEPAEAVA